MGDENEARPALLLLQVQQEIDDLAANRHVQRGGGFVEEDEIRPRRQRSRDGRALQLTAAHLIGIQGCEACAQLHLFQQLADPSPPSGLIQLRQLAQGVQQRLLQRHHRVEGADRVLEDHLQAAAQRPPLALGQGLNLAALIEDAAAVQARQIQHAAPQRRLAGAALADQADRLAAPQASWTRRPAPPPADAASRAAAG